MSRDCAKNSGEIYWRVSVLFRNHKFSRRLSGVFAAAAESIFDFSGKCGNRSTLIQQFSYPNSIVSHRMLLYEACYDYDVILVFS